MDPGPAGQRLLKHSTAGAGVCAIYSCHTRKQAGHPAMPVCSRHGGWRVRFRGHSGRAANIAGMTAVDPEAVIQSIHSTCLTALVTDWMMEAWYHPPLHE